MDGRAEGGCEDYGRPVDSFYRVTFADERGFRLWTERVMQFTSALRDVIPAVLDTRPVIFMPLRPAPGEPLVAYVSAGARAIAAHIYGGTNVDATPVSVDDLPQGLTMLFGEGVDAAEYQRLRADGSALVSFETPEDEVQALDLRLGGRR